jgi:hypothetical protein
LERRRTDLANQVAARPDVRRVDARTVESTVEKVRLLLNI